MTLAPLTVADIHDELKIRIAANRKECKQSDVVCKLTLHQSVCQRTAQELERLAAWIRENKVADYLILQAAKSS